MDETTDPFGILVGSVLSGTPGWRPVAPAALCSGYGWLGFHKVLRALRAIPEAAGRAGIAGMASITGVLAGNHKDNIY